MVVLLEADPAGVGQSCARRRLVEGFKVARVMRFSRCDSPQKPILAAGPCGVKQPPRVGIASRGAYNGRMDERTRLTAMVKAAGLAAKMSPRIFDSVLGKLPKHTHPNAPIGFHTPHDPRGYP